MRQEFIFSLWLGKRKNQ